MDLTYIPMARGFVYLCAVVDWFSRKVLSWRLSITMEADFCIEAVEEALAVMQARNIQYRPRDRSSPPSTSRRAEEGGDRHLNGWQGCVAGQRLRRAALRSSNTRKSTSRLQVCVRGRAAFGRYLIFYNGRRPHSSLDRQNTGSGLLQRAETNDGGGIIEAEIHLAKSPKLFRQTEPPLRPVRKRKLIDGMLVDWGISIRRACKV